MPRKRPTRRNCFRCACSELPNLMMIVWSDGSWTLHTSVPSDAKAPPAIAGKTCPNCGRDFSPFSLDEMTDAIWPARP